MCPGLGGGPTWTVALGATHRDTPIAGLHPLTQGHGHRSSSRLWLPSLDHLEQVPPVSEPQLPCSGSWWPEVDSLSGPLHPDG